MTTPGRVVLGALLVGVISSCGDGSEPAPDVILVGGPIVSPDAEWMSDGLTLQPQPDGIAIKGGRVSRVAGATEIRALAGPDTRVIELDGRTVLPGLTDNHLHSIGGGAGVDLSKVRTLQEVHAAIAGRAAVTDAGGVIVTNSDWHEGQLAEQRLPYRDDLDRAAPNHPVVVVRGGHEYILNSAALDRWGIDESTPDVPGGRIGRYDDARLNGELVDRAKSLVTLPPRPPVEEETALTFGEALISQPGPEGFREVFALD